MYIVATKKSSIRRRERTHNHHHQYKQSMELLLKSRFSSTKILPFFPKHSCPFHNLRLCPWSRFSSSRIRATFAVALDPSGWRQNFNTSGFPGPEEEFKMAQDYFKPAEGGILIDVSRGSCLFSRKFAKSGAYSKVSDLDFSVNMLRRCYDFMKDDISILSSNLALVRADISRLPFPSGSIDAVRAGAALHCWPSPSSAACPNRRQIRASVA